MNTEEDLSERRAAVLRAVVSHYVRTGEPVGSKTLVDGYRLGVSPATVRNEMVALEEAGYLFHPHTSAGRVPTDTGYRYFVDAWADEAKLPPKESHRVEEFFIDPALAVEDALRATASLLSGLTRQAAVVFAPAPEKSLVRHMEIVSLSKGRGMVIVVLDTGRVENRLISLPEGVDDAMLLRLAEALDRSAAGLPIDQTAARIDSVVKDLNEDLRELALEVKTCIERMDDPGERVFLEGTVNMLERDSFSDLETVRQVVGALEQRRLLLEVMADAIAGSDVSVRIGAENQAVEMRYCSIIAAPYGQNEPMGSLGIVGPTRMDYRRTIAAVHEVAAHLGQLLSRHGL